MVLKFVAWLHLVVFRLAAWLAGLIFKGLAKWVLVLVALLGEEFRRYAGLALSGTIIVVMGKLILALPDMPGKKWAVLFIVFVPGGLGDGGPPVGPVHDAEQHGTGTRPDPAEEARR